MEKLIIGRIYEHKFKDNPKTYQTPLKVVTNNKRKTEIENAKKLKQLNFCVRQISEVASQVTSIGQRYYFDYNFHIAKAFNNTRIQIFNNLHFALHEFKGRNEEIVVNTIVRTLELTYELIIFIQKNTPKSKYCGSESELQNCLYATDKLRYDIRTICGITKIDTSEINLSTKKTIDKINKYA
jgi:hypothetical protein